MPSAWAKAQPGTPRASGIGPWWRPPNVVLSLEPISRKQHGSRHLPHHKHWRQGRHAYDYGRPSAAPAAEAARSTDDGSMQELRALSRPGRVHFVGVGGTGMAPLAQLAASQGWQVSGSDVAANQRTRELEAAGVSVSLGHHPANLFSIATARASGPDVVVVSSAVPSSNPEVVAAQQAGIRTLKRGQWLAIATAGFQLIAVAGTHGKTTTSALMATALRSTQPEVTAIVGGAVADFGGTTGALCPQQHRNSHVSMQQRPPNSPATTARSQTALPSPFVLEADEYDGTFHGISPQLAVLTCIELDHVDQFPDLHAMQCAFATFARQTLPGGILLVCAEDPGCVQLQHALNGLHLKIMTYGHAGEAGVGRAPDFEAANVVSNSVGGSDFDACLQGTTFARVSIPLPGRHNVLNALAALAGACLLSAQRELSAATGQPVSLSTAATWLQEETQARSHQYQPAAVAASPMGAGHQHSIHSVHDGDQNGHGHVMRMASDAVRRAAVALASFGGIERRFQLVGRCQVGSSGRQVDVYDDYAHHPTEVRATLQAARQRCPHAAIWVVFQPHTFSRLAAFMRDFAVTLGQADRVVVTPVFAARETDTLGVDGRQLAELVRVQPPATYATSLMDAAEQVTRALKANHQPPQAAGTLAGGADGGQHVLVLTLGAGDVTQIGPQLLLMLRPA